MGKKRIIKQNEEDLLKEREKVDSKVKRETREPLKKIKEGRVYINSSYNNTIITLTDPSGNTLSWVSAGNIGFKGTKKATPFAASKVAQAVAQVALKMGIQKIDVLVKGIGSGRESAIRSLISGGLELMSIKDITPVPHNGCRPPKVRRM